MKHSDENTLPQLDELASRYQAGLNFFNRCATNQETRLVFPTVYNTHLLSRRVSVIARENDNQEELLQEALKRGKGRILPEDFSDESISKQIEEVKKSLPSYSKIILEKCVMDPLVDILHIYVKQLSLPENRNNRWLIESRKEAERTLLSHYHTLLQLELEEANTASNPTYEKARIVRDYIEQRQEYIDSLGDEYLATKDRRINLMELDLSGLDLTGVDLSDTNCQGSNFTGTNLSNVDLSDADLTNVDFANTNLRGADLSGTKIHPNVLARAKRINHIQGVDSATVDAANELKLKHFSHLLCVQKGNLLGIKNHTSSYAAQEVPINRVDTNIFLAERAIGRLYPLNGESTQETSTLLNSSVITNPKGKEPSSLIQPKEDVEDIYEQVHVSLVLNQLLLRTLSNTPLPIQEPKDAAYLLSPLKDTSPSPEEFGTIARVSTLCLSGKFIGHIEDYRHEVNPDKREVIRKDLLLYLEAGGTLPSGYESLEPYIRNDRDKIAQMPGDGSREDIVAYAKKIQAGTIKTPQAFETGIPLNLANKMTVDFFYKKQNPGEDGRKVEEIETTHSFFKEITKDPARAEALTSYIKQNHPILLALFSTNIDKILRVDGPIIKKSGSVFAARDPRYFNLWKKGLITIEIAHEVIPDHLAHFEEEGRTQKLVYDLIKFEMAALNYLDFTISRMPETASALRGDKVVQVVMEIGSMHHKITKREALEIIRSRLKELEELLKGNQSSLVEELSELDKKAHTPTPHQTQDTSKKEDISFNPRRRTLPTPIPKTPSVSPKAHSAPELSSLGLSVPATKDRDIPPSKKGNFEELRPTSSRQNQVKHPRSNLHERQPMTAVPSQTKPQSPQRSVLPHTTSNKPQQLYPLPEPAGRHQSQVKHPWSNLLERQPMTAVPSQTRSRLPQKSAPHSTASTPQQIYPLPGPATGYRQDQLKKHWSNLRGGRPMTTATSQGEKNDRGFF